MSWKDRHARARDVFRRARLTKGRYLGGLYWGTFGDMQKASVWVAQNTHGFIHFHVRDVVDRAAGRFVGA